MDIKTPFLNEAGRLRSGWRFGIFVVIYAALLQLLGIAGGVAISLAHLVIRPAPLLDDFIFRVVLFTSGAAAGVVCNRWLEGLPWRALGLTLHQRWFRDLAWGSIIGAASLAIAAMVALAAGGLRFTLAPKTMMFAVLRALLGTAALFILAALAEEITFRGYPLQTFVRARLAWFGVLITSLPFAVVHLNNPNVVAGFTFINTALAGVWLAVAYLRTRSLWFPLGVHWAWNWAQGSVFGIPVSGIRLVDNTLVHAIDQGPAWLTGGTYGIEGGAACTIALIVSTLFIWRTRLVCATPELARMTSQENPVQRNVHLLPQIFSPPSEGTDC